MEAGQTILGNKFYHLSESLEQSIYLNQNKIITLNKENRLETTIIKGNIFHLIYENSQNFFDKKVKLFFKNGVEIKIQNAENIKFDEDGNYYYKSGIGIYKNGKKIYEQIYLYNYFIVDGKNIVYLASGNVSGNEYLIFLNGKKIYSIEKKEDFIGVKNGNIFYILKGDNGLLSLYKNNEKLVEDFNKINLIGFTESGDILFYGRKGFNGIKYKIYKNSSLIIEDINTPSDIEFNNIGNITFKSLENENYNGKKLYVVYKDGEIIQSLFKGEVLGISDNGDIYTKENEIIFENGYSPKPIIKNFLKDEKGKYIFDYYIGVDENGEAIYKNGEKISEYYKDIGFFLKKD